MNNWNECEDIINTLLYSTSTYVYNRIENKHDKVDYHNTSRICRNIIGHANSALQAMELLMKYEMGLYKELNNTSRMKHLFCRDKTKYKFMAYDHAFDIVYCVSNRFNID